MQHINSQSLPHNHVSTHQQINLEEKLNEFQFQKYPTPEETISNNKNILYKRKKFFSTNLKESIQLIEFVLIVILYLRDLSFLKLIIRCCIHLIIININPEIFKYNQLQNSNMNHYIQGMIKMSFKILIYGNLFIILLHLIFSPINAKKFINDGTGFTGFSNGGLTVQFIGERLPSNRFELIVLDLCCFFVQLILLYIVGIVDNYEVFGLPNQLDSKTSLTTNEIELTNDGDTNVQSTNINDNEDQEEDDVHRKVILEENDGYNGNVQLLTIDLIKGIEMIMNIKVNILDSRSSSSDNDMENPNNNGYFGFPGSFPSAGSMV
ncbi:uncharacterized protein KGF55_003070 [Candida pseudojiufengensis]|uniref:uncharacterized protein n=1 Tax=Candida pseudojiufengensis TaxID=497109 RepID=UPI00222549A8|nr:uncharacterized protein KGF55_003070 [Candida pseudojiufengensis]KAI5963278.1 hypothetical protein KGF55_003070 [Candida pseudojiufengensis]